MRTKKHYENLMTHNTSASIGLSLASKAVYAAIHGTYDGNANDYNHESYRSIYKRLHAKYGEVMGSDDVLREMTISQVMGFLGSIKSDAKAAASRSNGKKGGRPKSKGKIE